MVRITLVAIMSLTWKVAATLELSSNESSKKIISVKELVEKHRIFVDIRSFVKDKPTRSGVCLTIGEFDWLCSILLYKQNEKKAVEMDSSYRVLKLLPRISGGYNINHIVGDVKKSIALNEIEVRHLVLRAGEIIKVINNIKKENKNDGNESTCFPMKDEDSTWDEATYKGAPLFGHSQKLEENQ